MAAINTNDMGKDQKELLAYLSDLYPIGEWRLVGSVPGIQGWILELWMPVEINAPSQPVHTWRYDPTTETIPDLLAKLKASLDNE